MPTLHLDALSTTALALLLLALGSQLKKRSRWLTRLCVPSPVIAGFGFAFLVWLLSHTMYRVRHVNLEAIPDEGAAVLVCNHVSYVDALLIAGSIRRPVRFVMYYRIFSLPVLNFVFRTLLFVLICAVGYGLAMVFVTPWLAKGLGYFNNYTLAPVLLLVFFVIGMIADRS